MNFFNLFKKQESKESVSNSALETCVCDFAITDLQLGILVTGNFIIVTMGIFSHTKIQLTAGIIVFKRNPFPGLLVSLLAYDQQERFKVATKIL